MMRLILCLWIAGWCATVECSQKDDGWNPSSVFEKWRHLNQDEVNSIWENVYAFVAPGTGTLDTACLPKATEFDVLVVLVARGKSGELCPLVRFLLQRRTASGATAEREEWVYPVGSEMVLRQHPAWNILTDPLPIGGDIRLADYPRRDRDHESHPEFFVCRKTVQGKWNVKIDPDWCFGSPLKTGYARPSSMMKAVVSDGSLRFVIPSWRVDDGVLDQQLSYSKTLVGGEGQTNIWSLAMYSGNPDHDGAKSCKVRFCLWNLMDEKIPKNAKCMGSVSFVLRNGIVKDGSLRTDVTNGMYTVSVKRVKKEFVAEREGQEVKVAYSEKHFVRYKLPSQNRSVNLLNGRGVIEWDDIDICCGDGCLSLFGSWPLASTLVPLDFTICGKDRLP